MPGVDGGFGAGEGVGEGGGQLGAEELGSAAEEFEAQGGGEGDLEAVFGAGGEGLCARGEG